MQDDFLNIEVLDWNREKTMNVCILSIIREELQEIVETYNMKPQNGDYLYWEGGIKEYPNIKIYCYQQNESGNIDSEQLTKYVLEKNYDYYFFIGTAGAVQSKLYDVIIASQVIYLGKGTNLSKGREYDGKALEITEKEKNLINTFLVHKKKNNNFDFEIDIAPVFSGENVEKNPKVNELKVGKEFSRHLAVIDMESYGVFKALRFQQSFGRRNLNSVVIIRGVSDKADMSKNSVYEDGITPEDRKKLAMKNVIEVLTEFILFLYGLKMESIV